MSQQRIDLYDAEPIASIQMTDLLISVKEDMSKRQRCCSFFIVMNKQVNYCYNVEEDYLQH